VRRGQREGGKGRENNLWVLDVIFAENIVYLVACIVPKSDKYLH